MMVVQLRVDLGQRGAMQQDERPESRGGQVRQAGLDAEDLERSGGHGGRAAADVGKDWTRAVGHHAPAACAATTRKTR